MDNSTHGMHDLLVRYMDGDLSVTEKQAVEETLASDAALQAEYQSLQQTRAAVRHYGLRQKVSEVHGEMMEELGPKVRKLSPGKRFFRYSLAVAASLVLLLGAYLAYHFFTLSPNKVFTSKYRTYETGTFRSGENTESTRAESAFREKDYKEVIRIHNASNDRSPQVEFLCGVAALELNDDAKAIECFREVLDADAQSGQAILKDEAEYYLSLSYIRNRDYDFALPLLQKIKKDPRHKYHSSVSNRLIWKVKLLKWR